MKIGRLLLSFVCVTAFSSCNQKMENDNKVLAENEYSDDIDKGELKIDSEFAVEATECGLLEVTLGELATTNGNANEIKELGESIKFDHGRGNAELAALAQKKNIAEPTSLSDEGRQKVDALAAKNGAAFDKAYAEFMVRDHHEEIKVFKREAEVGSDAEIREWAAKKVSTLEHHLMMAENAKKVVNGEQR